ncbi:MAG: peptidase S41 [Oscillospiraceae bacterium]|nr:peptidase S41 [Oscillospiraceae bacterium]
MIYFDILLFLLALLSCGAAYWLAGYAERVPDTRWRICYLIPAIIGILFSLHEGAEQCMAGVYLALLLLTAGVFSQKAAVRKKAAAAGALCALTALPLCLLIPSYRRKDYAADFRKGFSYMKKYYLLAEHKQLDLDALYQKYLPDFEAATAQKDAIANEIAWTKFCAEFHDGHVGYSSSRSVSNQALAQASGHDYGLVIVTLSDGKTVAVQTDASLEKYGIRNGTEILTWNGMTPAEADRQSELYAARSFADIDNEQFYAGICAAGTGGETVPVEFLDENGSVQRADLPQLSAPYSERLEAALDVLNRGVNADNLQFTELDDTTVCLRIRDMMDDTKSMESGDFSTVQRRLRSELVSFRKQGIRNAVIDIRSNGGGTDGIVTAVAELFAPEGEHYYVTNGVWDEQNRCFIREENGRFKTGGDVTFNGEQLLGDGHIVLLVNSGSASASDHLCHVLRGMENVTVMGFTESNGSAQGVFGLNLDYGSLSFSSSVMLEKDGSIFIDSGADRQSGNGLDIRVPLDETAVNALFEKDEDYVLEQALDLLHEKYP